MGIQALDNYERSLNLTGFSSQYTTSQGKKSHISHQAWRACSDYLCEGYSSCPQLRVDFHDHWLNSLLAMRLPFLFLSKLASLISSGASCSGPQFFCKWAWNWISFCGKGNQLSASHVHFWIVTKERDYTLQCSNYLSGLSSLLRDSQFYFTTADSIQHWVVLSIHCSPCDQTLDKLIQVNTRLHSLPFWFKYDDAESLHLVCLASLCISSALLTYSDLICMRDASLPHCPMLRTILTWNKNRLGWVDWLIILTSKG